MNRADNPQSPDDSPCAGCLDRGKCDGAMPADKDGRCLYWRVA